MATSNEGGVFPGSQPTSPQAPLDNPFFAIPHVGADGDFEEFGISENIFSPYTILGNPNVFDVLPDPNADGDSRAVTGRFDHAGDDPSGHSQDGNDGMAGGGPPGGPVGPTGGGGGTPPHPPPPPPPPGGPTGGGGGSHTDYVLPPPGSGGTGNSGSGDGIYSGDQGDYPGAPVSFADKDSSWRVDHPVPPPPGPPNLQLQQASNLYAAQTLIQDIENYLTSIMNRINTSNAYINTYNTIGVILKLIADVTGGDDEIELADTSSSYLIAMDVISGFLTQINNLIQAALNGKLLLLNKDGSNMTQQQTLTELYDIQAQLQAWYDGFQMIYNSLLAEGK